MFSICNGEIHISPLQNPPSTFHLIIFAFTNSSCLNTLFHEGLQNVDFPILSSVAHLLISSIVYCEILLIQER